MQKEAYLFHPIKTKALYVAALEAKSLRCEVYSVHSYVAVANLGRSKARMHRPKYSGALHLSLPKTKPHMSKQSPLLSNSLSGVVSQIPKGNVTRQIHSASINVAT